MKKQILIALAGLALPALAHADTIALWTFESATISATAATFGPLNAEVGSGQASGSHAASATAWSSPAGNGSAKSFSSNAWAVGDFYQFVVATTGLEDVKLTFDQGSSNTGPRDFKVSYSTDGSTFTDFSTYVVLANASPNPTWNSSTSSPIYTNVVDLSSVSAIENAASVYLRLVDTTTTSANGGTVASTGTSRVDNVLIEGTQIAVVPLPPAFLAASALFGLVVAGKKRRRAEA